MRKLALLVLGLAAVATAAPVAATPPKPSNDIFALVSSTTTSVRTADGNTFLTLTRVATLTGTFTGTATDTVVLVMHSNGTTSLRGAGVCTCTAEGRTGTFDYRFSGAGTFPTFASGRYVVMHGTGGLEGLHGVGTFSGSFAVAALEGTYHFD
jgi:Protein of unknown function (DUF3224)